MSKLSYTLIEQCVSRGNARERPVCIAPAPIDTRIWDRRALTRRASVGACVLAVLDAQAPDSDALVRRGLRLLCAATDQRPLLGVHGERRHLLHRLDALDVHAARSLLAHGGDVPWGVAVHAPQGRGGVQGARGNHHPNCFGVVSDGNNQNRNSQ